MRTEPVATSSATPCRACGGERRLVVMEHATGRTLNIACIACSCYVCGGPTDTPPECRDCHIYADVAHDRRADR